MSPSEVDSYAMQDAWETFLGVDSPIMIEMNKFASALGEEGATEAMNTFLGTHLSLPTELTC